VPEITWDDIVQVYQDRKSAEGEVMASMRAARDHFNGEIIVPLPEMDEREKPAIANLLVQGLDQTAMRVASTLPYNHFPALSPGKDKGVGSEDWARTRRLAVASWWQSSKMNLKLRRHARWLIGYARAPMVVLPDFDRGIPKYELRHPMGAYPAPNAQYEHDQPTDSIFTYRRTVKWLKSSYPEVWGQMVTRLGRDLDPRSSIELLEYFDADVRVLGVLATHATLIGMDPMQRPDAGSQVIGGYELHRFVNRAGICLATDAHRITIDRPQGQFDQVFGLFQNQARLMALETIAVEKGIFPDLALVGNTPGRTPSLVNGKWADGRSGEINVVKDGNVSPIQLNPGFMTQPLIDRYERGIRTAGVPAQFSGESPTNIATGRLGDGILSATVDFPIQEYQELTSDQLHDVNVRAIAVARTWFGNQKKTFHVGFGKDRGNVDYTPNQHFETDYHEVKYSAPGADINALVIGIGQRIGLGTLSRYSAMFQDPMIDDPEFEYRKVTSEKLQAALTDFVAQKVMEGALDPLDVVFLYEEVEKGADLAAAWTKASARAQTRQAELAEQQQGQGGQPPAPEALAPGLSGAPVGAAGPGAPIGPPTASMGNLSEMLGSLRQPRMLSSPMAGPGRAPANQPVG
jgi:hypothetical protein